ncbi:MAG: peptidoglycan-binding protein [Treponema sp.]|jgi:hypothetical protein|nr:peptidoglycan-binding protein [Treponema sp.]
MNCRSVTDRIYEAMGDKPLSFMSRLEIAVHLFTCPRCADTIARLESAMATLRDDYFPPAPDLEAAIMERISVEEAGVALDEAGETADSSLSIDDTDAGVPFRGWVITGLVVLLSLTSSFFGLNFGKVVESEGISFLIPLGITIGVVVTGYGAMLIGSHLKELSARFNLH